MSFPLCSSMAPPPAPTPGPRSAWASSRALITSYKLGHNMLIPWARCTAEFYAIWPTRQWAWRLLPPSRRSNRFRTTSLSVNFFRPVWEARLRAEAHVVSRGKNLGYTNVISPIRMVSRSQKRAVAAWFCEANTQNSAGRGTPFILPIPQNPRPTRDDSIPSSGIHSAE
jgi:hypothetical protein